MQEFDLVESKEFELEPSPYDTPTQNPEVNKRNVHIVNKAIQAHSQGQDVQEVLYQENLEEVDSSLSKDAQAYADNQADLISEAVSTVAYNSPEDLPVVAQSSKNYLDGLSQSGQKALAPYLHHLTSLEGSEKLSSKELRFLASGMRLTAHFADKLDQKSWTGIGADILGIIALPEASHLASQVSQDMLGEKNEFTSYLGSTSGIQAMQEFRMSLDGDDLVEFDNQLIESISEHSDNALKATQLAFEVLGQDPDMVNNQTIDKVDALTVVGGYATSVFKVIKSFNVMRRTAKAGDFKTAHDLAEQASTNPEFAKSVGVDPVEASLATNPVKPKGLFEGAPEGVEAELLLHRANIDDEFDKAIDTAKVEVELTDDELERAVANRRKYFSKIDGIKNLEVEAKDGYIEIRYDAYNVDGSKRMSNVQQKSSFTLDDLGGMQTDQTGILGMVASKVGIASKKPLAGKDVKTYVDNATSATFAKGKISKDLMKSVDRALAKVINSGKSMPKINDLLLSLDGRDVPIDYHSLVNVGHGGIRLTDKEFVAFRGVRHALDRAWELNNDIIKNEMRIKGIKRVDLGESTHFVKPIDESSQAFSSFNADTSAKALLPDGTTKKVLDEAEIDELYDQGYVLTKNNSKTSFDWFETETDGYVPYRFINRADIQDITGKVLNKTPNYLPKVRKDANVFITRTKEVLVNGEMQKVTTTEAYGSTLKQADDYIEKKRLEFIANGGDEDDWLKQGWDKKFDRESLTDSDAVDIASTGGGLIRGARKSKELEHAGDFGEGGRLDALDVLQRYMSTTADKMSFSQYRLEATERLRKQVMSYPELAEEAMKSSWEGLAEVVRNSKTLGNRQRAKLLAMHQQTSDMLRIPTKGEQAFQGAVRSIGKWLDKKGGKMQGMAKFMYKLDDSSPVNFLKSITHHAMLGLFNTSQLYVQGASVVNAVAVNPVSALRGMPAWALATMVDWTRDSVVISRKLKEASAKFGVDEKALLNDYNFWKKSGMFEGVVTSSADASGLANRMPYDAGVVRRSLTGIADAGLIPYRAGELASMRGSFFTALEHQKALDGKAFKYDNATLKKVTARAEDYRLNMSSANKAPFQRGIIGLPFQFKQVFTKSLEFYGSTAFTRRERIQGGLAQVALFGATGIPVVNYFSERIMQALGLTSENLTSEQLVQVKRGGVGHLLENHLDVDALVVERISLSADVFEEFNSMFLEADTPMYKQFLGPTFTTGDKAVDLVTNLVMAGRMVIEADDVNDEVMDTVSNLLGRSLANLTSSGRRVMAGLDLMEGQVKNSKGVIIYETEPKLRDVFARFMGFGSQELDDLYKLKKGQYATKTLMKDYSDRYLSLLTDLSTAIDSQDEQGTKSAQIALSIVRRNLDNLAVRVVGEEDAEDFADKVWDSTLKRLIKPNDEMSKALNTAIFDSFHKLDKGATETSIIYSKKKEELNGK